MLKQIEVTGLKVEDDTDSCCHHWLIEPAAGPVSLGNCLNCGETREFQNSIRMEQDNY